MTNREAVRLIRNLPTMCEFTDAYGEPIDSDAYYEAVDMAISALQEQDLQPTCNNLATDTISRTEAIDYCYALINAENPSDPSDEWNYSQERINQTEVILHHLEFMPSAQPETTDEQTIAHLQSSGWMQQHDKEMGRLADDSGSYDSLIPCEDTTDRQVAGKLEPCKDAVSREDVINFLCDWICAPGERCVSTCKCLKGIRELPPVKPMRDCSGCRFKFLPERKEDETE